MSKESKNHRPSTAEYRARIEELRPKLPGNYKIKVMQQLPAYDNYRGGILLMNVMAGRSTDYDILDALEKIAAEHQAEIGGQPC